MGNFSKSPLDLLLDNLQKGYIGLHIEQGVPVLDRDLNLLNDLISATVRAVISRYIGDGVAAGVEGFAVQAISDPNNFLIGAGAPAPAIGVCLVGGIEVTIKSNLTYKDQTGVLPLTTPNATQPDPRQDIVFLDVWLDEVDGLADDDLLNDDDVGLQTSVRLKPAWLARVAEGIPVPNPAPGHTHYPLARLTRPRNNPVIQANMISDLRQTRLTLADAERRIGTLESLFQPAFEFMPQQGIPGQEITLNGKNFSLGSVSVLFGATNATLTIAPTDTQIKVLVPIMPAGVVKITVITGMGSVVSTNNFLVQPGSAGGPAPTFGTPEFAPQSGIVNQEITINGNNFNAPGLVVKFGTVSASVNSVTATAIKVFVPTGVTGVVKITVTTDNGGVISTASFLVL